MAFPKTELAVVEALVEWKVNFIHQHVVETPTGAFVLDFFFPERGLAIELDTTGWHSKIREADAKRDKVLRTLGLTVIRLWDNGRPENAVRTVLTTLLERA